MCGNICFDYTKFKITRSTKINSRFGRTRVVELLPSKFLFDTSLITKEIRFQKEMWKESPANIAYEAFEYTDEYKLLNRIQHNQGTQLLSTSHLSTSTYSDSDDRENLKSTSIASLRMKDMYKICTLMFTPSDAGIQINALKRPVWIDLGSGNGFPTFVAALMTDTMCFGYDILPCRKQAAEHMFQRIVQQLDGKDFTPGSKSRMLRSLKQIFFSVADIAAPGTWQNFPNEIAVFCFDARMSENDVKSVFLDMEKHKFSCCLVSNAPLQKVKTFGLVKPFSVVTGITAQTQIAGQSFTFNMYRWENEESVISSIIDRKKHVFNQGSFLYLPLCIVCLHIYIFSSFLYKCTQIFLRYGGSNFSRIFVYRELYFDKFFMYLFESMDFKTLVDYLLCRIYIYFQGVYPQVHLNPPRRHHYHLQRNRCRHMKVN